MTSRPQFSVRSRAQIDALLARQHVGRLAFTYRDRVDIEPIHYVFAGGWIYVRTEPGTKLATVSHNPWVALEVDEVRGLFDWESAVVRGRLEVLRDDQHASAQLRYQEGLAALRTLVPETLTENDPTPARRVLCGLFVDEAEGRRAEPAGSVSA